MGAVLVDAVVIGAGISGCVCASALIKEHNLQRVVVLEALDRIGGRTFSPHGVDLGAAWSWPGHDRNLGKLVAELGIETVSQDVPGEAIAELHDGRIVSMGQGQSPSGPGSVRLLGGTGTLCKGLVAKYNLDVRLGAKVAAVRDSPEDGGSVTVSTASGESWTARAVVVSAPPKQAASIAFEPPLANEKLRAMASTPTWMGNAGKVCLSFGAAANAFWRTKGKLNGTLMSQRGPVVQAWDNSDANQASLCGFVFDKDRELLADLQAQADAGAAQLKSPILDQFERAFGPEARLFTAVSCQSWAHADRFEPPAGECAASPAQVSRYSTEYGDAQLLRSHGARIIFAGTETTPFENGHMEGAVIAGKRAAAQVAAILTTNP